MAKQIRKSNVSPLPDATGDEEILDPTVWVVSIPSQEKGNEIDIFARIEDENIILAALKRTNGMDGIIRHLDDLEVWNLIGSIGSGKRQKSDSCIRDQDARRLREALKSDFSPDYLTLLLTNAIVHALVVAKLHAATWRRVSQKLTLAAQKRKFGKGPKEKKKRQNELMDAIRQLLETGVPRNARTILEKLMKRDDAERLVLRKHKIENKDGKLEIKLEPLSEKTIANLLSKIPNCNP